MATDVTMPRLSDSMEEGTVLQWLVAVGHEVARGEPLVEIETDKANMTYEADIDGVLVEIVAQEGTTVALGEPIARIGDASEIRQVGGHAAEGAETQASAVPSARGLDPEAGAVESGPAIGATGASSGDGATRERVPRARSDGANGVGNDRVKATPVARRMARDSDLELAQLEGTGPGGRIVKADVQAAVEARGSRPKPPPPATEPAARAAAEHAGDGAGPKGQAEVQELTRLQQTVSRRMAESKATAPDFALSLDVDMTLAVELRARLKEIADPAPSFNDMVVKAAAMALTEYPRVNAAYRDGRWELYERVNVGVAVAASEALVVPTIFDADRKSLGQIAQDARTVIEKVREGNVTAPELSGGTFTVSNLGMYGIERFVGIINPPQACILTVGSLAKRPAVDDHGDVVARDLMALTLVCDHRILYGADGAQFLGRTRALLEEPIGLAL